MRPTLTHVALAGLIGHFGHAAVEQFARAAYDRVPLERRAGIVLVRLNVEMTKNAFVFIQFFIGQLLRNELSIGVAGIIAFNFWKDFAKRRGQLDQRLILLGSKIVLEQFVALNRAAN
jgi:hypothetical protein